MRTRTLCVGLVYAWLAIACDGDFTPGSRIDKLRILALQADRPFAAPGERVHLQPLIVDPTGRALTFSSGTCVDPLAATADDCFAALSAPLAPLDLDASGFDVQVPEDARSRLPVAGRRAGMVGIVLIACPGTIAAGHTQHVPARCLDEHGRALALHEFEVGWKRVFVRERDQNTNPEIEELRWDGKPWPADEIISAETCDAKLREFDACPKRLRHRISVKTPAAEHGSDEFGTPFEEQLIVQSYATAGLFDQDVRIAAAADMEWVPQRDPNSELIRLWFVVRDNRGGVGFTSRQVRSP